MTPDPQRELTRLIALYGKRFSHPVPSGFLQGATPTEDLILVLEQAIASAKPVAGWAPSDAREGKPG